MDRTELAMEKRAKGYNCAQAVACTFCDISGMDEEHIFKVAEGFGGGLGGSGDVCGAVSAMIMLAGFIKAGKISELPRTNKNETYDLACMMMEKFKEKNTTLICRELKDGPIRSCNGCIEDAVKIIEEFLEK